MKIVIVLVAYNRPFETKRLFDSISKAEFYNDTVDLIIDIDKGEKQEEIALALEKKEWTHGDFLIIKRDKKMGLKNHIFDCCDYVNKYDALIMLEDDLLVSQSFYIYAKAACNFYKNDKRIAQLSLYSYSINEFAYKPFYPAFSNADVYAMQVPQSWGQCWTRQMWLDFKNFIINSGDNFSYSAKMPKCINNWGDNSWKKVFANYLVLTNKFVVYPYHSLSTNCSGIGEHNMVQLLGYCVPLEGLRDHFSFAVFDSCTKYDAFFERIFEIDSVKFDSCIDLYGLKENFDGYKTLVSTKRRKYRVIKELSLIKKPIEENLIDAHNGCGIFIYDLSKKAKKPINNRRVLLEYFGNHSWKEALLAGYYGILNAFKMRFKGRKH